VPNPPVERLTKRSEFLNVAKTGERYVTPAFIIQMVRRSPEGPVRYGITASRKVGGAVERNRAKRRLRALLKLVLAPQDHSGIDYVFIARQEILKRNFSLMAQELEKGLKTLCKG
jgi:ribonuclease P protein component